MSSEASSSVTSMRRSMTRPWIFAHPPRGGRGSRRRCPVRRRAWQGVPRAPRARRRPSHVRRAVQAAGVDRRHRFRRLRRGDGPGRGGVHRMGSRTHRTHHRRGNHPRPSRSQCPADWPPVGPSRGRHPPGRRRPPDVTVCRGGRQPRHVRRLRPPSPARPLHQLRNPGRI
jgi:hypothetical protein